MSTPSPNDWPLLLVVVGPTASGKTAVALELAPRLNGEIVSADSMQIYKYLDIGTAKPTPAERAAVPHHLIDFVEPDQPYSVAQFKADAERAIDDILRRGRQPLLVGGTGLYVRALVEGFTLTEVARDPDLRRRLEEEAEAFGNERLYARLQAVDPTTAARLSANDRRRIIRALEVYEATGEPLSRLHAKAGKRPPRYRFAGFGLRWERQALYARINARVERMFEAGWVAEVRGLMDRGYDESLQALRSLGYGRIQAYLRGEADLATTLALIQQDTRRLAKRQMTWFRAEPWIRWIDVPPDGSLSGPVERILAEFACLKGKNGIK